MPDLLRLDVRDEHEAFTLINRLSPSVIFLPAAMPSADVCEIEPEKCWAINVEGVCSIIRVAREIRAKLVFFSSDYVFDGQSGPYREIDEPRPINVYGKAKLATERAIQDQMDDYLIVRINGVYGWEQRRKNFVLGMIDRLRSGQEMRVPTDQIGCPTYADNMVEVVLNLVDANERGIFHVAGPCAMDRYTFACTVADIFGLDRRLLVPAATGELAQKAERPLKGGLRIDKVQQCVETALVGPGEGLGLMKNEGDPFIARSTACG
jgi:dTDP-4-dehydrorhamnose reductase